MNRWRQRAGELLESRRFPFAAACIAVVLALPALGFGFMADDYMQRAVFVQPEALDGMFGDPFNDFFTFADGDPARMDRFVDLGLYPWIAHSDLRFSFFRPLTVATHWIDYALWPDTPWLMHLHSLLWFAALVVAAGFFYRRMMGPGVAAGLAALLFAIDDAHAWPAAWIANRNGLIALLLGVLALGLHDRWRRDGQPHAAVLATVLFGLALLAKESAIAVVGYVLAYAAFVDKAALRSRTLSLSPYVAVTALWRAYYVLAGFGASGSGGYIDPMAAPLEFIRAVAARAPVLLQGQWALPPSDIYTFAPPELKWILVTSGAILVLLLATLLSPLLRRDPLARFWCAGMLLALIPLCAAGPQDRLLMFPGLGAMGLLAQFLVDVRTHGLTRPANFVARWTMRPAYVALIVVHLILAPLLLPGTILGVSWTSKTMIRTIENVLPSGPDVTDKTIVFANVANYPMGTYLYIVRGLSGDPVPAHVRSFAPVSMTAVPMELTRTDERTIVARPDGGYPWSLMRDRAHPLALGETIELTGMTAEITKLAEEGWPTEVAFRFDKPLDDPSLVWFRADGPDFVPLAPPAIGQTIRVEPFARAGE